MRENFNILSKTSFFLLFLCRYLYADRFEADAENIMDILYLARKYILPGLVDDCEKLAKQYISTKSFWNILCKSLQNQETEIVEACLRFIRLNTFEVFVEPNGFTKIEHRTLQYVLDHAILNGTENVIYVFCIRWAKHQLQKQNQEPTMLNIRDILGPSLFKIQFQNFAAASFTQSVANEGLLDDNIILQFYKCISLGDSGLHSDLPEGFEFKERRNESTPKTATARKGTSREYASYMSISQTKMKVVSDNDTEILVTGLDIKMDRCSCVNKDNREIDCFFSDREESVQINGVDCLEKITYGPGKLGSNERCYRKLDTMPCPVTVTLHLKPQPVQEEFVIDIDLTPRNDYIYSFNCVTNDVSYVDQDKGIIMESYDTDISPIHSISYIIAK